MNSSANREERWARLGFAAIGALGIATAVTLEGHPRMSLAAPFALVGALLAFAAVGVLMGSGSPGFATVVSRIGRSGRSPLVPLVCVLGVTVVVAMLMRRRGLTDPQRRTIEREPSRVVLLDPPIASPPGSDSASFSAGPAPSDLASIPILSVYDIGTWKETDLVQEIQVLALRASDEGMAKDPGKRRCARPTLERFQALVNESEETLNALRRELARASRERSGYVDRGAPPRAPDAVVSSLRQQLERSVHEARQLDQRIVGCLEEAGLKR